MFEIKKDLMGVRSGVEYPLTMAHAHQFVYVNGYSFYLSGDSEVKCDEGDKFESAFGRELAETNATIDMLKEYKKVLIKFTKQPEWRKEKPDLNCKCEWTPEKVGALHSNGAYWKDLIKRYGGKRKEEKQESKTLAELVGKWAIRTKSPEGPTDTSFCSDPVYIRKVTDTHAIYIMQGFPKNEHIFNGRWLDNNWVDYDKLMSKDK